MVVELKHIIDRNPSTLIGKTAYQSKIFGTRCCHELCPLAPAGTPLSTAVGLSQLLMVVDVKATALSEAVIATTVAVLAVLGAVAEVSEAVVAAAEAGMPVVAAVAVVLVVNASSGSVVILPWRAVAVRGRSSVRQRRAWRSSCPNCSATCSVGAHSTMA